MSAILIAEDEPRISSFLEKGLRGAGFQPVTKGDGREALRAALDGEFELMLLDVGLPSMDGFEVLRRLRASNTSLPVIMLTARSSARDSVAGLTGGADDYVPKPFRFDELLARIELEPPHRTQQVFAAEHLIGVTQKLFRESEFARGQLDGASVRRRGAGPEIQFEALVSEAHRLR